MIIMFLIDHQHNRQSMIQKMVYLTLVVSVTATLITSAKIVDAADALPGFTRLTPGWTPGTLIPHVFVQHHHGAMGTGEWTPDTRQVSTVRVGQSNRWSVIFAGTSLVENDVVL